MTKDNQSAELRSRFVTNLQSLIKKRNLTVRETAQKAGITDFKRFYRWASIGISRATHEHDADLEKLQTFFGLRTLGQFWNEPESVSDALRSAGQIDVDYDSAYKLLVALKGMTEAESSQFRQHIDMLFQQVTKEQSPDDILEPKTAEQILAYIKNNHRSLFEPFIGPNAEDEKAFLAFIQENLERIGNPKTFLNGLIKKAIKHSKGGAE